MIQLWLIWTFFSQKFSFNSFKYLWFLNFIQNVKKKHTKKNKLTNQSWEKCYSNKQIDKLGHFGSLSLLSGKDFPKKLCSISFEYLWSLNFLQNMKKKFNSQFWEKCCKNGQMGKLAHFRASENFPKKFSSVSFKYLWSLNFKQNIKKKLICQSWERCCGKKWMYIQMDRPKFIGPSQSMGPKTHTVWYLEKEGWPKIETWSIDRALNNEHFYGKSMQKRCTKN